MTSSPAASSSSSSRPTTFSALLNIHGRDIDGTASIFRANVLGPGSNGLNSNYDRDSVSYDEGGNNPQSAEGFGGSLEARLRFRRRHDADLDHGVRNDRKLQPRRHRRRLRRGFPFLAAVRRALPAGQRRRRSVHPVPVAVDQDGIDDLDQFTQEIPHRLAGERPPVLAGRRLLFRFRVLRRQTSTTFFAPASDRQRGRTSNTAWAVFGHVSYDVTDAFTVTGGAALHGRRQGPHRFQAPPSPSRRRPSPTTR